MSAFKTNAESEAAKDITVYMNISNQGKLVTDNLGEIMANRAVKVTDSDKNGTITCHEALLAAHEQYNSADGYNISGSSINKFWGITSGNILFFVNDATSYDYVTDKEIFNNDKLTISLNSDSKYYSDWYTFFDKTELTVDKNESFDLTLKGHMGMSSTEDKVLSGISIGIWKNNAFSAIGQKITDEYGKISLSFDEAGVYYVTANGTVRDKVTDWETYAQVDFDCPIIAPICVVTVEETADNNEKPYFKSLEFATTAFSKDVWITGKTFNPSTLTYSLLMKSSASTLRLQSTTEYDTDKYDAVAEYTDAYGEKQKIHVNSKAPTEFKNQPFDNSVMTITIAENGNAENKTIYTFNISRIRDENKSIKSNGIVLSSSARVLSSTLYKGYTEGTMLKADKNGALTSGKGVSGTQYFYRTFIYDDIDSFNLSLASSSAYAHIRYSIDDGETWKNVAQGGGITDTIKINESGTSEVIIQIIDDKTYDANVKAEKDGFADSEPKQYKIWVDKVKLSAANILTAEVTNGDWYPVFSPDTYSYWLVIKNGDSAPILTYTVPEGSTVKIKSTTQVKDDNGKYNVQLGISQTSIIVTSSDGNFTNTYKFGYRKKSAFDVPDKVVDYLCIGSQYTNKSTGLYPEATLNGTLKSIGNFGGYITYYYEEPITDNPNNKYGMDFYIIGNGNETNLDSMGEPGQVYISEDGKTWYALAGSEHYEKKAIWDYTITYKKSDDGKSYWTDNYGNSIDYGAYDWPNKDYYLNDVAKKDSYTFTGVVLESQLGSIMGDSTSTNSFAAKVKFGYADYYNSNMSGTSFADTNPYISNPSKANGFDIAWAVDKDGIPIDVSEKEFHYIKVATASNIHAGSFNEKSTEVTYVVRTPKQNEEVGVTTAPTGVTISDGAESKTVNFKEGQKVYSANLGNMKYVSITVNGTSEDDNIYINNQRVDSGIAAEGFKVTKSNGETLVRVIVQNGDKEPVIYLLRLTSDAEENDEIIESIKINADGTVREVTSKNGIDYQSNVGHRISSISITPIVGQDVSFTINGETIKDTYDINYGSNVFEIIATDANNNTQTVRLIVQRDNAPTLTGTTVTVNFTLYGDEKHGDSEIHTYKNNKKSLPVWISQKSYTVDACSTVVDVFEMALKDANLTWKNDGGNYISKINGLAEFDNGPLSGWMYIINGKYSDRGVSEQMVRNGDKIIFHYTDDYTQEDEQDKFSNSSANNLTMYTVNFETNGGNVIASQSIEKGSVVKKPATPKKDGYVFEGWYTDKNLTIKYDFSNKVISGFTIYAKWIKSELNDVDNENALTDFDDIKIGSWYEEAIAYVIKSNLFNGVSDDKFAPDSNMTRGMLITVLYRLENPVAKERTHTFNDVIDGSWYEDAIAWAVECGIINGVDEANFSPDGDITREQMISIIYRYAKNKNYNTDDMSDLACFTDVNEISEYAMDAMKWAHAVGLIDGINETSISPKTTATRAHVATILMRFAKYIAK